MTTDTLQNTLTEGGLDPTFGNNGKITLITVNYHNARGRYIVEGPDNALYVAGKFNYLQTPDFPAIARVLGNGQADLGFGDLGVISIRDAHNFNIRKPIFSVQASPEQTKILICAVSSDQIAMARFDMNGRPDQSFGNNGVVRLRVPVNPSMSDQEELQTSRASDETGPCIEHNGKIYVINRVFMPIWIANVAVLCRLNGDGSLDTSFNGTGYVPIANKHWGNTQIMDMIVKNGKITLCGALHIAEGAQNALVVRLNEDGSFDNEFAEKGWATFEGTDIRFERLIEDSTDRILVAGYGQKDTSRSGLLACLTNEGKLAPDFNRGALLFENLGGHSFEFSGVAKAADKFIVTGSLVLPDAASGFLVARYMTDGKLDLNFGDGNGWTYTPIAGNRAEAQNMSLQKDGKILVVGNQIDGQGMLRTLIYRYLNGIQ
ncbi:hypothetical protein [Pseudomonas sp. Irchel s3h17]|uniref:hypothetical protein n=1 Tax=Pseudomonas sp. Irchel s3h17 TaxID=2009182 RepID=UPI000BA368BD|nr:hypothetical protein [Pseudomonas sp. Irchel s3h17]